MDEEPLPLEEAVLEPFSSSATLAADTRRPKRLKLEPRLESDLRARDPRPFFLRARTDAVVRVLALAAVVTARADLAQSTLTVNSAEDGVVAVL